MPWDQKAARERVREKRQVRMSVLEALRWLARERCVRKNCGTVCLCGPCHARRALDYHEREGSWS